MADGSSTLADKIDRAVQRVTPFAYRMQRTSRRWMRRAMRKPRRFAGMRRYRLPVDEVPVAGFELDVVVCFRRRSVAPLLAETQAPLSRRQRDPTAVKRFLRR